MSSRWSIHLAYSPGPLQQINFYSKNFLNLLFLNKKYFHNHFFSHKKLQKNNFQSKKIPYTSPKKPKYLNKNISYNYKEKIFLNKKISYMCQKTDFFYEKVKVLHLRCVLNMTFILTMLAKLIMIFN